MDDETLSQQFCEDLFQSDEEKMIIRRLLQGVQDKDLISELLLVNEEEEAE